MSSLSKNFIKGLTIIIVSMFSSVLFATEPVYQRDGYAIRGYDTVAYFEQDEPVAGNEQFSYEYKGATWLFSSAENLELFRNNPARYAPQYNGWCAYAMGRYGKTVRVDPRAYTIKDDRLYLNFNRRIGTRFNEDIDQYIADGDVNWERLLSE